MSYRPIGGDPIMTDTELVYEGAALAQLIPGPGTQIRFDPSAPGGAVARVTASASIEAAGTLSAGVGAVVPPQFESAVVGRDIEVSITLRTTTEDHDELAIGYFVVGDADTGWQRRTVPPGGGVLTLRHRVPANTPTGNNEWVGIWPDLRGAEREVVVERIAVRILPSDPE